VRGARGQPEERALRRRGAAGSVARTGRLALAGVVLAGCAGRPPEEREAGPGDRSGEDTASLAPVHRNDQVGRVVDKQHWPAPPADVSSGMSAGEKVVDSAGQAPKDMSAGPAPLPSPRAMPAGYLGFARACEARERLVVAAVGDLLLHHELQIQATRAATRFRVLWAGVEDILQRADLTYANLEVPLAAGVLRSGEETADPGLVFDRKVYTAYPRFNVHPSMAEDLVTSGVDVVSTANNHALDRGSLGADKTIAALKAAGLKYTGTRARAEESAPWHTTTQARGLTVAWLACTLHTNMVEDPAKQVLRCFDDRTVEHEVGKLAKDPAIDAVIVTPHWGKEYKPLPDAAQKAFAGRLAEAGATAVIGGHPHVLQPWEVRTTKDGREVFVMYSLGNFASHQIELPQRSSMVLYLGLTRPPGKKAFVHGARYVPLHVRQKGDEFFVEAVDRVGGPKNSRALTVGVFGESAVLAPGAPLATRPACPAQSMVTPSSPGGGSG
jgi:hypothetical protein